MATDTAQLAQRFKDIRLEWDLRPGETETKAQNKALAPLHAWLRKGVDSPEVVIRAVQVLMADPERPAIHKRPAVKQVVDQVAKAWESAGHTEQDIRILRGMLLATWPHDLREGGFALAPLLDSAWVGIRGRISKEKHLEEWRKQFLIARAREQNSETENGHSLQAEPAPEFSEITVAPLTKQKAVKHTRNRFAHFEAEEAEEIQVAAAIENHHALLSALAQQLNTSNKFVQQLATRDSAFTELLQGVLDDLTSQHQQLDLLWWGQARYSSITRQAYRRIPDATERLWWMAWESSELATGLEVEPAACFLIETLYQLDNRVDAQKRPLKEWLAELIGALRRIHEDGQHVEDMPMSELLEELAGDDPLGLPVTWARLQAASSKPSAGSLEDRLRDELAVDPDTLLDLGDWAAWIFREALLDRHLDEFGEQ